MPGVVVTQCRLISDVDIVYRKDGIRVTRSVDAVCARRRRLLAGPSAAQLGAADRYSTMTGTDVTTVLGR